MCVLRAVSLDRLDKLLTVGQTNRLSEIHLSGVAFIVLSQLMRIAEFAVLLYIVFR